MEERPGMDREALLETLVESMEVEREVKDSADALKDAVVASVTTQVKWWRRFSVVSAILIAIMIVYSIDNRVVLDEIREQQVDISALRDFVDDMQSRDRSQLDRQAARILAGVESAVFVKELLCSTPGFAEACATLEGETDGQ